ncbi:hypothetical protein GWI33_008659 [Rhynchophorus ferrugineus]|uniref:RRM domain-containing protein n=1 Tax=Rhynchophorus ferrugineus TaxID=354439 RepID=A0A834MH92_RHYFE|nr:hypothetical protein GWI33_008659 [Rhynchophorus ferrugineus]
MANKMEMSLDDIIKSDKSGRGRGSRPGSGKVERNRSQRRGANFWKGHGRGGRIVESRSRVGVNDVWKHDLFESYGHRRVAAARAVVRATSESTKLTVSNLHFGVTNTDIQELFAEFGPLNTVAVRYDRTGRSLGTADVIFERQSDAIKAMRQCNGLPLDGQPMNIQLVTNELPTLPRRSMVAGFVGPSGNRKFRNAGRTANRGSPSRGRAGNQGSQPQKHITAEDLDAELDAYIKERSEKSSSCLEN